VRRRPARQYGVKHIAQIVFGDDVSMLVEIFHSIIDPAEIQHRSLIR
jgi:hypothetical protein